MLIIAHMMQIVICWLKSISFAAMFTMKFLLTDATSPE